MKNGTWLSKIATALICIVLAPILLVAAVVAGIAMLFHIPRERREYRRSRYYSDLRKKYRFGILKSPAYRFYDPAMRRKLPIRFVRQESNGLEYFIYRDTVFLFPDFDLLNPTDGGGWQVDVAGKTFDEAFRALCARLDNEYDLPIKVLIERNAIPVPDLDRADLPEGVFVTWGYENAFENEDSPLKKILPQSADELLDMMRKTPDLCGTAVLPDGSDGVISWDLFDGAEVQIGFDTDECSLGIVKKSKTASPMTWHPEITHWHPDTEDIYKEVRRIGTAGNITVIRSSPLAKTVLYSGRKEGCPYPPDKKGLLCRYHYFEAKAVGAEDPDR